MKSRVLVEFVVKYTIMILNFKYTNWKYLDKPLIWRIICWSKLMLK